MFRKKQTQSTLRYCQRATELPYDDLSEYREFSVAVVRISQFRDFPHPRDDAAPCAMGLLDGSATFLDGSEEPMLPVKIAFHDEVAPAGGHVGNGWMDQHYGAKENFFVLRLSIADPGHKLFKQVNSALERAAISKERFLHLRFRRSEETKPFETKSVADSVDTTNGILKAIEAGEAKFPRIVFDEVLFHDELRLAAEPWAWAWNELDAGGARFRSPGVAKWRTDRARWFK